jgi:hypothetical protein
MQIPKSEIRNPNEIPGRKSQRLFRAPGNRNFGCVFLKIPSDFGFWISGFLRACLSAATAWRGLAVCIFLTLAAAGCGTAVSDGHNTALDGVDLVTMTDQMSASIIADPAVQQAFARTGSLKVVVEPVINQMRAEILPAGAADAFTARLRALLSHHAPQEFTWIMNKATFYRMRGQELEGVEPGPSPDAINPDYELTATFTSIANENDQGRNDYYVCNYSLQSLKDRTVLWTKSYEVQKRAVKGFLD